MTVFFPSLQPFKKLSQRRAFSAEILFSILILLSAVDVIGWVFLISVVSRFIAT